MEKRFLKQLFSRNNGCPYRVWLCVHSASFTTVVDIEDLRIEAMKDFPWLTKDIIQVEVSDRTNSMPLKIGIAFCIPDGITVPAGYRKTTSKIGFA